MQKTWKSKVLPEPNQAQLKNFLALRGLSLNEFQSMNPIVRIQTMRECQQHFYGPKDQGKTNG